MSASLQYLVTCDGNECERNGVPYDDGKSSYVSAAEQRAIYHDDGWRRLDGCDYCPACLLKRKAGDTGRAARLKAARLAAGLSARAVSDMCGIDIDTLYRAERTDGPRTQQRIVSALCEIYGKTL